MKVDTETGEIIEEEPVFKVYENGDVEEILEEAVNPFLEVHPIEEVLVTGLATIKVPPLTQDPEVVRLSEEALRIQMYAQTTEITDIEGDKRVTNDLAAIADMKKKVSARLKEWLQPLKDHEKAIKDAFAMLSGPLETADDTLRKKLIDFRQEQKKQRDAEERAARLQEEANRAKIEAAQQSGEQVVEIEPVPEVVTMETPKTVRADIGSSTMTMIKKWRFKPGLSLKEILEKLPAEYHMVNETKIGQAVRAKDSRVTEADFGGVIEIYEEPTVKIKGR